MYSFHRTHSGFTLIELMVTIAIVAILLAISVPGFQSFIEMIRSERIASDLRSAVNYARSEAIKTGEPVSVCAANSSNTGCATSAKTDWTDGWLVVQGPDVFQVWQAVPVGYEVIAFDELVFRPTGETLASVTQYIEITKQSSEKACIFISPIGQIREVQAAC